MEEQPGARFTSRCGTARFPPWRLTRRSPARVYAGASKSTDARMSWYPANISFGGLVNALAIDPQTPSTVYAGTIEHKVDDDGDTLPCAASSASGIFKSTNGGVNWVD